MNANLKARKLKTKGILLYFGNDEKAIEVGEYIDNLQSKIDKAIEYIDDLCKYSDGTYFNYGDDLSPKHIVDILKEDK